MRTLLLPQPCSVPCFWFCVFFLSRVCYAFMPWRKVQLERLVAYQGNMRIMQCMVHRLFSKSPIMHHIQGVGGWKWSGTKFVVPNFCEKNRANFYSHVQEFIPDFPRFSNILLLSCIFIIFMTKKILWLFAPQNDRFPPHKCNPNDQIFTQSTFVFANVLR